MNKNEAKYVVDIASVDGQTNHTFVSNFRNEVLAFLERYDHEGAAIFLRIESHDTEEIYGILNGESA